MTQKAPCPDGTVERSRGRVSAAPVRHRSRLRAQAESAQRAADSCGGTVPARAAACRRGAAARRSVPCSAALDPGLSAGSTCGGFSRHNTVQRSTPAAAASMAAPFAPDTVEGAGGRLRKMPPSRRRRPPPGPQQPRGARLDPAARQDHCAEDRHCKAWLPRISAAISTTRRNPRQSAAACRDMPGRERARAAAVGAETAAAGDPQRPQSRGDQQSGVQPERRPQPGLADHFAGQQRAEG